MQISKNRYENYERDAMTQKESCTFVYAFFAQWLVGWL